MRPDEFSDLAGRCGPEKKQSLLSQCILAFEGIRLREYAELLGLRGVTTPSRPHFRCSPTSLGVAYVAGEV
jgi:hypothetical protein